MSPKPGAHHRCFKGAFRPDPPHVGPCQLCRTSTRAANSVGHLLPWLLVMGLFVHAELCTHVHMHTCAHAHGHMHTHTPWRASQERGRALLGAPISLWHGVAHTHARAAVGAAGTGSLDANV